MGLRAASQGCLRASFWHVSPLGMLTFPRRILFGVVWRIRAAGLPNRIFPQSVVKSPLGFFSACLPRQLQKGPKDSFAPTLLSAAPSANIWKSAAACLPHCLFCITTFRTQPVPGGSKLMCPLPAADQFNETSRLGFKARCAYAKWNLETHHPAQPTTLHSHQFWLASSTAIFFCLILRAKTHHGWPSDPTNPIPSTCARAFTDARPAKRPVPGPAPEHDNPCNFEGWSLPCVQVNLRDPATKRTQFPVAPFEPLMPDIFNQSDWAVGPPEHQYQAPASPPECLKSTLPTNARRSIHQDACRMKLPYLQANLTQRPVALGHIHLRFAWQVWHLWHWAGSGGGHRGTLRGKRGTWWHPPSFRITGVALGHIHLRFAWQVWHLWHWAGALGPVWVAGDAAALCAAGVALGHIHLRFAWQVWHLVTSTFVLRGKRGPYGTGLALVSHAIFVTHHLSHTTLSHTIFHTPSLTHPLSRLFHTPSLSHNMFHTLSFTHPLSHPTLSHTAFDTPSFTHHIVTHHLCHTTSFTHYLSHTIFNTQLCHTPSLTHHLSHITLSPTIFETQSFTHNFVTHHLPHTIFNTQLCHTPSSTHHLSPHHLSHTTLSHTPLSPHHLSQTTLSHTILRHTIFHTPLCHTPSFTDHFVTRHLSDTVTDHFVSHHLSPHHPSHTTFVTHHLSPHHLSHTTLSHTLFHHTIFHTTLSHTLFHHTIFHTQLCHTPSFTYNFVTHNFVLLLDPPPHALSFLPSPSPLQHVVLIIGRSYLVG